MTTKTVPQLLIAALFNNAKAAHLPNARLSFDDGATSISVSYWLHHMDRELTGQTLRHADSDWWAFSYVAPGLWADGYLGWAAITHDGMRIISAREMADELEKRGL